MILHTELRAMYAVARTD